MSAMTRLSRDPKDQRLLNLGSLSAQAWDAIQAEQRTVEMTELLIRALQLFKERKLDGPVLSLDDRLPLECVIHGSYPDQVDRLLREFPWILGPVSYMRPVTFVTVAVATGRKFIAQLQQAFVATVYRTNTEADRRMLSHVSFFEPDGTPFGRRESIGLKDAIKRLLDEHEAQRMDLRIRNIVFSGGDLDFQYLFRPPKGHDSFDAFLAHLAEGA